MPFELLCEVLDSAGHHVNCNRLSVSCSFVLLHLALVLRVHVQEVVEVCWQERLECHLNCVDVRDLDQLAFDDVVFEGP